MTGNRKLVVALVAVILVALRPEAGVSIAAIAVAFFGAHTIADSKWAKPNAAP